MLCNHIKADAWPTPQEYRRGWRFADPCQEMDYGVHFVENEEGELVWQTSCGEYHVRTLRLNRTLLVACRRQRNEFRTRLAKAITLVEQLEQQVAISSDLEAGQLQRQGLLPPPPGTDHILRITSCLLIRPANEPTTIETGTHVPVIFRSVFAKSTLKRNVRCSPSLVKYK